MIIHIVLKTELVIIIAIKIILLQNLYFNTFFYKSLIAYNLFVDIKVLF